MSLHGTKAARNRLALIKQANENSITTLIKTLVTREEKVNLVTERNPLHYMFGEYLTSRKYDESYESFINRTYIGEVNEKENSRSI
jgi:hypothetical protein